MLFVLIMKETISFVKTENLKIDPLRNENMKPGLHFGMCVSRIRTLVDMFSLPCLEGRLTQGLADPGQLL